MTQAEYELLVRLETGPSVLRPIESVPEGRERFQSTVLLLLELRAKGWVRVPDGRVARNAEGEAILAGPCDLTEAGRRALEDDRRLGPRPSGSYER
jgi:hypothetical protein